MQSLLITGAYGFVGSNIAEYFYEKGYRKLSALDISIMQSSYYSSKYIWENTNEIVWDEIDIIIHLAGIAHDTQEKTSLTEYYDINVGLTKEIFRYFIRSKAKKFVFLSTVKAVTDSIHYKVLTENEKTNPKTPYGMSKLEAESYLLSQQVPAGKQLYILRPCMIHGPGNKGNLNILYDYVKRGFPYPLGAFNNMRSFTSIGNLSFILEQIIMREITPGIYHVADDEPLSTSTIIELMGMVINKKVRIWKIHPRWILLMAKIGDKFHLPYNSNRLRKLTENFIVSNKKLTNELGMPLPITSKSGLLFTLKSLSGNTG